jgi:hypothetical protein
MSGCRNLWSQMDFSTGNMYLLCGWHSFISRAAQSLIDDLGKHVPYKEGSVQAPITYLGADLFKYTIPSDNQNSSMKQVWAMWSTDYVKKAMQEVEWELSYSDSYLPKRVQTPFLQTIILMNWTSHGSLVQMKQNVIKTLLTSLDG